MRLLRHAGREGATEGEAVAEARTKKEGGGSGAK